MPWYDFHHVVGFAETNLLGNVYYVHHLGWQGRCRELFLREKAPEIIEEFARGLRLVTVRCSCEYFGELAAFDEVIVRMRLDEMGVNRLVLAFDYLLAGEPSGRLVARGSQEIATMRASDRGLVAEPIPEVLRRALEPYRPAT